MNDQIIGRLGESLGAPVGKVGLVDVPAALITAQPELSHFTPGVWHGSLWVGGCSDRSGFQYTSEPRNRARFAHLALLYGWIGAGDHQFIYRNDPPHLVFSVDHGNFFHGGPHWTIAGLSGAPPANADAVIVSSCALTDPELRAAVHNLDAINARVIAASVAAPLDTWGITMDERSAVAAYLAKRRQELLTQFGSTP